MPTDPSSQNRLHAMRLDYRQATLDEADASADAIEQFRRWFDETNRAGVVEPNAFTLATATPDGTPSARVLLLKEFDAGGFVFYTNYESRKGRELAVNPRAAAVFFWQAMERQVRVEGVVTRIDPAESKAYFDVRPRPSRIGAWASRQSEVIASRDVVEAREKALAAEFGPDVPLPDFWGGYRLVPTVLEFWQGRPSRLHDRLRYTRDAPSWRIDRLSP